MVLGLNPILLLFNRDEIFTDVKLHSRINRGAKKEKVNVVNNAQRHSKVHLVKDVPKPLQVTGELLKKISKMDKTLLKNYPGIEWDKIMRLRDIVSHHYEKVDHEIIFDICKNHIPRLKSTIHDIIEKEN